MKLKFFINCKEASRLMSEDMEDPLPFGKRSLLRLHLFLCAACNTIFRQIKGLSDTVHRYSQAEKELPFPYNAALSDQAREKIKEAIRKRYS